jgi:hypothetical protein
MKMDLRREHPPGGAPHQTQSHNEIFLITTIFSKIGGLPQEISQKWQSVLLESLADLTSLALPVLTQVQEPKKAEQLVKSLSSRVCRIITLVNSRAQPALKPVSQVPLLAQFESDHNVELYLHASPPYLDLALPSPPCLAVFDLDSTLIENETIDELARSIGVLDQVAAITERAMQGELDFEASLRARVALLKGVKANVWEEVKTRIAFVEGSRKLCIALRKLGCRLVVLSGGFVPIVEWVKGELGLDEGRANLVS